MDRKRSFDEAAAEFLRMAEEGARAHGPRFTDADDVASFLGPKGRFAREIPNFVPREGQLKLSEGCLEAFEQGRLLIAEAGTGTGKTYAYLLPAILRQGTTVISTASKALQDQLIQKDLPRICDLLHIPHEYFALKGFSNYLCLKRFSEFKAAYQNSQGLQFEDDARVRERARLVESLQKLVMEQQKLAENDAPGCNFCELNSLYSREVTAQLCCDRNTCRGRRCMFHGVCFALKARQKAIHSKIVVVNHALFFADLKVDDNFNPSSPCILLPKYSELIFDEAHELPEVGRNHLGSELSLHDIKKLGEDVDSIIRQDKLEVREEFLKGFQNLMTAAEAVFEHLKGRNDSASSHRNFLFYRYEDFDESESDPGRRYDHPSESFRLVMGELWRALNAMEKFIADIKAFDEDVFGNLETKVSCMRVTLEDLMHLDDVKSKRYGKEVGSVEVGRRGFSMRITPLEIGDLFGKFLASCREHATGVVMTSATLSVAGKFTKFRRDIGASGDKDAVAEIMVPSGFDYPNQAALFVSESFPEVGAKSRELRIVGMLAGIIERNAGGIFVLTTSLNSLNAMAEILRKRFGGQREILAQNGGMSNSELLERFRSLGNAILVGTSSFWAGVDVPGRALSLVIIDKLPFTSPSDPVFKARCDHYDAANPGRSSFADISVPEAVIELRQGIGRLIRHERDHGGIVICDPRIRGRGYGKVFMKSLPPVKMANSIEDLSVILQQFDEAFDETAGR